MNELNLFYGNSSVFILKKKNSFPVTRYYFVADPMDFSRIKDSDIACILFSVLSIANIINIPFLYCICKLINLHITLLN